MLGKEDEEGMKRVQLACVSMMRERERKSSLMY